MGQQTTRDHPPQDAVAGTDPTTRVGTDPLWTGVLRALWSQPGTALAVSVAVAVASLVAGAAPLFEASVGNEVFRQQLEAADPVDAGLTVTILRSRPDAARLTAFEEAMGQHLPDELGAPTMTVDGQATVLDTRLFRTTSADLAAEQQRLSTVSPPPVEEGRRAVRLLGHPGVVDHLDVVWETGEPGLWVPEVVADQLGLEPDDELLYTVDLSSEVRLVEPIPFAGVYAEPWLAPDAFWRTLPPTMLPNPPSRVVPETQRQVALIGEPDVVLEVARNVGEVVRTIWQLPRGEVPTLPDGRRLAARYASFEEALVTPGDGLREVWEGELEGLTTRAPVTASRLGQLLDEARSGQASIAPLVRTLSIAGVALGLAVIAVTGAYVTRRRSSQVHLLWSQGVGAVAHAFRTGLELLLPAAFGAVLGWLGALAAVRVQGPWGALETPWILAAARAALVAAAVGLVTLAIVAGVTAVTMARGDGRAGSRGRIVLLSVLAAATVASWFLIRGGDASAGSNPLSQAFPLLVIALAAAVATSVLALLLSRWAGTLPTVWLDLAVQRLRLAAVSTTPLVMAAAVAVGLVVYATGLASSVAVSARDKAVAHVGGETSVRVQERLSDVEEVPDDAALVARGRTRSPTTGGSATVLVVDVDALTEVAPWGEGFSDTDLDAVLRTIAVDGPTSPAPIAAAGTRARPLGSTVALETRAFSVPAEVVATVSALPGMAETGPTYLVDRRAFARPEPEEDLEAALERQLSSFQVLLWTPADVDTMLPQVAAAGLEAVEVLTVRDQLATPRLLAHLASTDFVRLLGAIATLVALGALVLYGSARQRERVLGYALSRRMGLGASTHRLALMAELLALLVLAAIVAIPAALVGLTAVLPALDPQPGVGPPMVVSLPLGGAALVAGAMLVVGIGYGFLLQRQAERTPVAEVLRVSD